MTRRPGRLANSDEGLEAVLAPGTPSVCLVGKSWDFHVETALGATLEQNLEMIAGSIGHVVAQGREALFDAEHFFDGYKANPAFALDCLRVAEEAGRAGWCCATPTAAPCPEEIERIVADVVKAVPGEKLGIHCHDDTGNAVANSLAAVRAGARQIQGTLNGLGERCGNANLVTHADPDADAEARP